jgi:hypothetical protein
MKEYGWIPLEEFRKLPVPTVLDLLIVISESRKREEEELEKQSKRRMRRSGR